MTLTEQIQDDMKSAMKEKNQAKLAAVRAIKAEILKNKLRAEVQISLMLMCSS